MGLVLEVDPTFVRTIFSTKGLTQGVWTRRKVSFWTAYLIIAALFVFCFTRYRKETIDAIFPKLVTFSFTTAVILYATEPAVLLLQTLFLCYPATSEGPEPTGDSADRNADIAVIIPSYNPAGATAIAATVRACLVHFEPGQIFVVENQNQNLTNPPEATRTELARAGLSVEYIYNPIGNKTLALYAGAIAAKEYKYLLLIDDDVHLPSDMLFDRSIFSETVKAVGYPIRAIHSDHTQRHNLLIAWQALEYKVSDYARLFQSKYSTLVHGHGAISLWDRATAIHCLRQHDTVFYADDVKMGLWLLSNNLEMKMDHRFLIDTDAPMSMLGKGPNLYNQRVRSWDMAEHAYTARHVRALWQTRHRTIGGTLVLKWFQFYTVYCIFADWIRLPALVIAGLYDVRYLAVISLYVIWFQVLVLFLWEFLAFRKSSGRRARFAVILTFPVYKFGSIILRWLGMGMAYFVFLPNLTPPKTIPELEAELGPKLEECRELGKTLKRRVPIWLVDWHDEFGSYFRYYNPEEPTATDEQQPSEEESDSGFDIAVSPPTSFPDPPWGVSEHLVIGELSATEVKASTEILLVRHGGAVSAPRVRKLLQAHPAIATTQDHTGDYLIHTLSYADTPYDVLKVVAEFSDRSTINHKGESPLHLACKSGADFAIVELFGKKWPRTIKTSDYSGHFPLHLACANQTSVDVVQYLLMEYREAQSKVDQQGNLPLHAALMGVTSLDVIESLLEDTSSSPGLLHANTDGDLPLHLACVHPHAHSYVPVILRACPQAAEQPNAKGRLALHLACQSACPLEIFQEAGLLFMASLADKQGNTPLHLACHCRRLHQDNLRLLVEAAPHAVTTTNHKGELPLHLLCGAGSGPATDDEVAAALELLTDQPWSDTVLRIDEARRFPLHRACAVPSPRLVLVQTLLQKFPKAIFCRDCDQHTPLHLACQQTKVSVAVVRQLLRASGVDLTPSTGNKGDADKTDEREVDDEKDLQDENVPLAEPTLSQTSVHKNLRPNFSSEGSTFVDTGGGAWYRTIPLRDTPIHLAIRAGAAKEVVLLLKAALSQAREEANAEGETPRQLARRLRREGSRRRSRSREREHKSSRTDRLIGS